MPREASLAAFLLARARRRAALIFATRCAVFSFALVAARAGSRRLWCASARGMWKVGTRWLLILMLFGHEAGAGLCGKREAGLTRAMLGVDVKGDGC